MLNDFISVARSYGVTADEAAEAINSAIAKLPPLGELEIMMISANPSLNFFQKRRLIKEIRRSMK